MKSEGAQLHLIIVLPNLSVWSGHPQAGRLLYTVASYSQSPPYVVAPKLCGRVASYT